MTIALQDLVTPLTRQDVETSVYNVLTLLGVDTTAWKPGSVVRTMISATSLVLAALSTLQAQIAASGFLALSQGDWLTVVAQQVYGLDRLQATFASGSITLTNSGGGIYLFSAGGLTFRNPTTGKTYHNTADISLGAVSSASGPIQADALGAASTSAAATITFLVTPFPGVTCSNAAAVVGRDAETDVSLRTRCSELLGSLSPHGPWDAYTFAARSALTSAGAGAGVNRTRLTKDGFGNVTIYLATASGVITGTIGDRTSALGAADDAIQRNAAPLAVTAHTLSATAVVIPVTYEVWLYNTAGLTDAQVQSAISAVLVAFFAAQPIGGNVVSGVGSVYVDAIRAAIESAVPQIFHTLVTAPGADVVLTAGQVPVLGTITVTAVHQLPPPEGFGA
jgi:phage-related baseplate assembly protein